MTSKSQSEPKTSNHDSSYALSRNLNASARLNYQYFLWKDTLTFNIHPSIPLPLQTAQIADIATGTSIWLLSTARENLNAELLGLDISLDQTPHKEFLPHNIKLRIWNVYDEVPEDLLEKFDVVHSRLLGLAVRNGDADTAKVFRNVLKMLKPGGHFQWDEMSEIDGVVKTTTTKKAPAMDEILQNLNKRDSSGEWSLRLAETARDNGFVDARLYRFDDRMEMGRAYSEVEMLFIREFAGRLEEMGKVEEAGKYWKLVNGAVKEIEEGAVLRVPKVVCVARKPGKEMVQEMSHWFVDEVVDLDPATKDFFRKWSGLDGEALVAHIRNIRDLAWAVARFPCIGMFRFVSPNIKVLDSYPSIIARARIKGTNILDIGCCFGQNLRALAAEGISTENMYATDIKSELWDLGFELFGDREKMKATFVQANILEPEAESPLNRFNGKMDIIIACLFLHLFNWDEQVIAMRKIVKLSKPGTLVVGRQVASLEKGEIVSRSWATAFLHNVDTFREIWRYVAMETGTSWKVDAVQRTALRTVERGVVTGEDGYVIEFVVTRES